MSACELQQQSVSFPSQFLFCCNTGLFGNIWCCRGDTELLLAKLFGKENVACTLPAQISDCALSNRWPIQSITA